MTRRAPRWTGTIAVLCASVALLSSCSGGTSPNASGTTTTSTVPPATTSTGPDVGLAGPLRPRRPVLAGRGLHAGPAREERPARRHDHQGLQFAADAPDRPAAWRRSRFAGPPGHQGPVLRQLRHHAGGHPGIDPRARGQVRPVRQRGLAVHAEQRAGGTVHVRGSTPSPSPTPTVSAMIFTPAANLSPVLSPGYSTSNQLGSGKGKFSGYLGLNMAGQGAAVSDMVEIQGQQAEDQPGFTSFVRQAAAPGEDRRPGASGAARHHLRRTGEWCRQSGDPDRRGGGDQVTGRRLLAERAGRVTPVPELRAGRCRSRGVVPRVVRRRSGG